MVRKLGWSLSLKFSNCAERVYNIIYNNCPLAGVRQRPFVLRVRPVRAWSVFVEPTSAQRIQHLFPCFRKI